MVSLPEPIFLILYYSWSINLCPLSQAVVGIILKEAQTSLWSEIQQSASVNYSQKAADIADQLSHMGDLGLKLLSNDKAIFD